MIRRFAAAVTLLFALAAAPPPPAPRDTVVTQHVMHLGNGDALAYTATAGTLTLRDDHNEPTANVFYVAYTTGDRKRPVTFLYNGGPGSASLWLHIGAFGPRRIVTSSTPFAPPSAALADNPSTLLDTSDLVFVDPVGTGYSTVTGKGANKDFWGVDEDIREFSQFIRRWIAANDRAGSPKFLLGESYGTFRSAGLVDQLQKDGVACNGVILISSLLDYADDFGVPGDENVPDAFAIPSEAAVAWYHKKVPNPPADVQTFVDAARTFTSDVYLPAIMRPQMATHADAQSTLAQQLHGLIGLDTDYLLRADLRISTTRFEGQLLRSEGKILGRYDGRYAGNATDRNRGTPEFDPSYESVAPAFMSAFTAYAKSELNWTTDRIYRALPGEIVNNWNFKRRGFFGRVLAPTVIPDLREAMHVNPNLRVFAASGLFDLATPFYATEYELGEVGSDPAVRARITLGYYQSGHMIYLTDDALHALRADLGRFYATAIAAH